MSGTANIFDDENEPECSNLDSIWETFKCFPKKIFKIAKEAIFDH